MAYVQDQTDQTQQAAPMSQAPQTSSGGVAGAAVSGVSGAPGGQGATSVPNSTQAPPVQNLQAYLTANAPQAVQMGQNIGNNLSTQANQVTGDINADQAATDQQIQAQNVAPNQSLINSAASNPSQFVQDPNNVAAFQQQENASYNGPTTYESTPDYTTLQNEVTNAQNNAPDINKPGGVQQLVTGQEQNPTMGEENLDTLLLQENPDALATISKAESAYPNLGAALSNSATTEDNAIQQAIGNDQADQQNVQSTFFTGPNAEVPAWENSLNNELASAQSGTQTYNTDVANQQTALAPLFQDINSYEASNPSYNLAAPPTLQQSDVAAPTLQSVATPEDYSTQAALSELLGSNLGATPINQSTVGKAGTFQTPQFNPLDVQGYLNPLVENAANQVGSQASVNNPSWNDNKFNSPNENTNISSELLEQLFGNQGGPAGTGPISGLENFYGQLENSGNAPTALAPAAGNQSLAQYLQQHLGYSPNVGNSYTVS